jgi:hypothetical protein
LVLNVTDEWARQWLESGDGRRWLDSHDLPREPTYAPERECKVGDPQPVIEIDLSDGQVITEPVLEIRGSAYAEEGFRHWRLEYGLGANPDSWSALAESNDPAENRTLHVWSLSGVPNGTVTLRLTLIGKEAEVDTTVRLTIGLPTPTPSPAPVTDTPSPTPTDTETPTATATLPLTETPVETITPFP